MIHTFSPVFMLSLHLVVRIQCCSSMLLWYFSLKGINVSSCLLILLSQNPLCCCMLLKFGDEFSNECTSISINTRIYHTAFMASSTVQYDELTIPVEKFGSSEFMMFSCVLAVLKSFSDIGWRIVTSGECTMIPENMCAISRYVGVKLVNSWAISFVNFCAQSQ